nr:MAG TPA: hypothetical protein [Caudoviricetes sp.]
MLGVSWRRSISEVIAYLYHSTVISLIMSWNTGKNGPEQ